LDARRNSWNPGKQENILRELFMRWKKNIDEALGIDADRKMKM